VILGVSGRNQWFERHNLVDVAINIFGFAPFGFFLSAWLQERNLSAGRSVLFTLLLGISLSLAIELAQSYLPTRDSSLLDLASNTMGAAVGVLLFAAAWFRS
jgi:VanZ family protein